MISMSKEELAQDGLISVKDACKFLAVSRATAWKLMDRGELPFVRVGGSRRIPRRALTAYVSDGMRNV